MFVFILKTLECSKQSYEILLKYRMINNDVTQYSNGFKD